MKQQALRDILSPYFKALFWPHYDQNLGQYENRYNVSQRIKGYSDCLLDNGIMSTEEHNYIMSKLIDFLCYNPVIKLT